MTDLTQRGGMLAAIVVLISCAADGDRLSQAVERGSAAATTDGSRPTADVGSTAGSAAQVASPGDAVPVDLNEPTLLTLDDDLLDLCAPLDLRAEYLVPPPWEAVMPDPELAGLVDCLREAAADMHGFELVGGTSLPGHLPYPTEGHGRSDWLRQTLSEHGVPFRGFIVTPGEHAPGLPLVDNQVHLRLAS